MNLISHEMCHFGQYKKILQGVLIKFNAHYNYMYYHLIDQFSNSFDKILLAYSSSETLHRIQSVCDEEIQSKTCHCQIHKTYNRNRSIAHLVTAMTLH